MGTQECKAWKLFIRNPALFKEIEMKFKRTPLTMIQRSA
jgi:hypothetical protein